ncbi:hypothetical protein FA048_17990 [Pedobacter polaris]|uniref:Uncharacterized protein n=1 Tax=Pedobacter polaris TaxID=2571273 RepID=A0A4U1CI22_9SPHI|nr:hypothetical protein [Pedobacter polaris]TKC05610.1 hypothetical protein FA048_17990 [Pedobacter polaris]
MKKEKSKSESKKAKKELEDKLTAAFTAIVADYGKAKKTKSIIEKFAKQLSKKIDLKSKTETVAEVVAAPVKEKVVKAKPVKKAIETAE